MRIPCTGCIAETLCAVAGQCDKIDPFLDGMRGPISEQPADTFRLIGVRPPLKRKRRRRKVCAACKGDGIKAGAACTACDGTGKPTSSQIGLFK